MIRGSKKENRKLRGGERNHSRYPRLRHSRCSYFRLKESAGRRVRSGPSVFETPPPGGGGRGVRVGNEVEKMDRVVRMIEWMSNEFGPSDTVWFIERKKTLADCISARLLGSTREEADGWLDDSLGVAYKGVIPLLTLPTLQTRCIQRTGRTSRSVSTCSEPFLLPVPCPLGAAEFNKSHGRIPPWWPALS